MEIFNQERINEIQNEAREFANANISTNSEDNWQTIYELKRRSLMDQVNWDAEKSFMIDQLRKNEKQLQDLTNRYRDSQKAYVSKAEKEIKELEAEIVVLKGQVESLKRQVH